MKIYHVYEIINPITKLPFYVGWTSRSAELRYKEHLRETRTKVINFEKVKTINEILNSGLRPQFNIVYETFDKDLSINKEIELIALYKRTKDGGILTNISKGGEHHVVTDEVKQKLSALRKGKTWDNIFGESKAAELKENLSKKTKGSQNGMFGKTHTNDAKNKMSEKLKGKVSHPIGEYQKTQIRKSNSERVWTTESKIKMSESQRKRKLERPETFAKGPFTQEHKDAISKAALGKGEKFTFVHNVYGIFVGTNKDLVRAFPEIFNKPYHGAEVWKLSAGHYKSCKGWILG